MNAPTAAVGTLYLVPTPLDFGCEPADGESAPNLQLFLPDETIRTASRLDHWITENAKSTRAFLKRVHALHPLGTPLQSQNIRELPRQIHKKGDHLPGGDETAVQGLLDAALKGLDIGLVSEAGMPAIADPGSSVVRAAHALGIRVCPLVGPISLMLALAGSGLNGQNFAFQGYTPQDAGERVRRLKELESAALRSGQTQILIETPYRNAALLQALLQTLQPNTRLAVCAGLGLNQQTLRSATVADWKRQRLSERLPLDAPSVFLLGR